MECEICVGRRAKVTSGKPNLITSAALLLRDFWLVGCILTQTKPKRDGMDPYAYTAPS